MMALKLFVLVLAALPGQYLGDGKDATKGRCSGEDGTCAAVDGRAEPAKVKKRDRKSKKASGDPECTDRNENCRVWSSSGECKNNPMYMLANCKKSCDACGGGPSTEAMRQSMQSCVDSDACQDCNAACQGWAETGECHKNPSYMKANCAASCGLCKAGDPHPSEHPDCQDTHSQCYSLAERGGCHVNRTEMLRQCMRSCRICGQNDPCRPNVSDTGTLPGSGSLNSLMERVIKDENVTILNREPYVLLLHNVISDKLVESILDIFSSNWERSRVGGVIGSDEVNNIRTSEQQWCRKECATLSPIEELTRRVEGIVGTHRKKFEDLQVLKYSEGQYYKSHNDFVPEQVRMPVGPRVLTLFVYLNDVEQGGATDFPKLGLSVPPRKGNAILWPSVLDSDPFAEDERSYHEGKPPVGNSTKFAMNFWVHQYDFRTYNDMSCLWSRRPRGSYVK